VATQPPSQIDGLLPGPRHEAADLAAKARCDVEASVTKRTTPLVVGDRDLFKLAGKPKISKHLKAEGLIAQGCPVLILRESDFQRIVVGQDALGL